MSKTHRGGCLCGAVRFTVTGPLRPVAFCHCSQCRKQTGLYYAATSAPREAVAVTGEDAITWFASSDKAERGFCRTCGSALFWRASGSATVSILAGALDEADHLTSDRHIYTRDRPGWYAVADGLPQYTQSD